MKEIRKMDLEAMEEGMKKILNFLKDRMPDVKMKVFQVHVILALLINQVKMTFECPWEIFSEILFMTFLIAFQIVYLLE